MSEAPNSKQKLFEFLDAMDESVLVSEAEKDQLKAWCDRLSEHSPIPEPAKQQQAAEGVWRSRFASFGAKHSESMPLKHTSNLAIQSFGNLPKVTVKVEKLLQEIHVESNAYNNVVHLTNETGDAAAVLVMFGKYECDEENAQRYGVSFYRVALFCADDRDDADFRAAFGIDSDTELDKEFRPPALHSDIVYLDDETRINYGKLGGFYVLTRDDTAPYSIPA